MKKTIYSKPVIILRKKNKGENSIEELAYNFQRELNTELVILPNSSSGKISNIIKNILFIRKIKAPVYHLISMDAYLLPFLHGKKIITYHDLGTLRVSRNWLYQIVRKILFLNPSKKFADYITFISNQTKNEYISIMKPKSTENLSVIYNPYNEKLRFLREPKNSKFTLLHIGTATRKNLISTIKACKNLDVKLIVIGILNKEQLSELQINKIDYENYYDISFEEIIHYYSICDAVSFPSSYEGFGMPIIEANIMHKPIIAGDIPILHEVANDAALFVDPLNIQEIRKAIENLMNNVNLRKDLVNKGIQNAKRFDKEKIFSKYRELYSK